MDEVVSSTFVEDENPDLLQPVEPDTEVKNWLVEYVGEKLNPPNDEVTVEMIIQVMAEEFPEFLMPIAEENFIRGYSQALNDVEEGEKLMNKHFGSREDLDA
tara:strand:+ start:1150 stop:1455 length:306 start_codon:yes stop_codon:yes gene_type:complete